MVKFGTGGWRAVIGDGFTRSNIQLLTKAICIRMKTVGKAQQGIILGYDRRFLLWRKAGCCHMFPVSASGISSRTCLSTKAWMITSVKQTL